MIVSDIIYSVNDLMEILQVKRKTVLKFITDRELIAFKIGNQYRVTKECFDKFVERRIKGSFD